MTSTTFDIAVIGEALMDVVEADDDSASLAHPGGSPYNVAVGLARLGRRTAYVGRLSTDPLGRLLRRHAERSGVDLRLVVDAREPSTVALVGLDADGVARYDFGVEGTADFRFTADELARVPDRTPAVHFGSLTSWLAPGDAAVAQRVRDLRRAGAAISYDPNVRPHLQPDARVARAQVEAAVPLAHLVKTSEEDVAWTHPGVHPDVVAHDWLTRGADVVVVTHGGRGARAHAASGTLEVAAPAIRVADTVGAGDAFMSGLLHALLHRGLLTPSGLTGIDAGTLGDVVGYAAAVAAFTCTRAGANPPRRAELDASDLRPAPAPR